MRAILHLPGGGVKEVIIRKPPPLELIIPITKAMDNSPHIEPFGPTRPFNLIKLHLKIHLLGVLGEVAFYD